MPDYAWIIDKDHLFDPAERGIGPSYEDEAGISGPSDAPQELLDVLGTGQGAEFRMYDGDDVLYYSGRLVPAELADTEDGFGPLSDFGGPNAGCATIKYKRQCAGIVVWETL